jgi:hypothetical protein
MMIDPGMFFSAIPHQKGAQRVLSKAPRGA